jgi:hypothetical protein
VVGSLLGLGSSCRTDETGLAGFVSSKRRWQPWRWVSSNCMSAAETHPFGHLDGASMEGPWPSVKESLENRVELKSWRGESRSRRMTVEGVETSWLPYGYLPTCPFVSLIAGEGAIEGCKKDTISRTASFRGDKQTPTKLRSTNIETDQRPVCIYP